MSVYYVSQLFLYAQKLEMTVIDEVLNSTISRQNGPDAG